MTVPIGTPKGIEVRETWNLVDSRPNFDEEFIVGHFWWRNALILGGNILTWRDGSIRGIRSLRFRNDHRFQTFNFIDLGELSREWLFGIAVFLLGIEPERILWNCCFLLGRKSRRILWNCCFSLGRKSRRILWNCCFLLGRKSRRILWIFCFLLGRKSRRILWNCCFLLGRKRGSPAGRTAAAAAAASQELSTSGRTPGASRPGTKYPVRENPSLRCMSGSIVYTTWLGNPKPQLCLQVRIMHQNMRHCSSVWGRLYDKFLWSASWRHQSKCHMIAHNLWCAYPCITYICII